MEQASERWRTLQCDSLSLCATPDTINLTIRPPIDSEYRTHQVFWVRNANAAAAVSPLRKIEQALRIGVVKIDGVLIRHHELDAPKGIVGARALSQHIREASFVQVFRLHRLIGNRMEVAIAELEILKVARA